MKKKFEDLKRFKEVLNKIELIKSKYYIDDEEFYYLDVNKLEKNIEYLELLKDLQEFYKKGYYNDLVF